MRFLGLLVCAALYAQSPTGQIRLEVKDPSGAAMQASGTLRALTTRTDRVFETDAQGRAILSDLPFGRYRLEVSKAGFVTLAVLIDVQSASPVSRTLTMALAPASPSRVDVVATTPLPGVDLPIEEVPAPVQTGSHEDVEKSGALDLSDFMNRRLNGVYVNEMQGNPFQPDVNYRGYTASPLLGTPQGLSVYMDGVRQNQPFGDVVSWDLIQSNAISSATLMPGSDPLFGLNTLGGALSIQTKDGVRNAGLSGTLTYGSSGRKALQAEYGGGKATGFNWFLAANAFHESGWRFDSPSDVRQGFARLGWRTGKTDLGLNLAYAYNTLTGNGLQDYRLLANNYTSVYTVPDITGNRSPSLNFRVQHSFSTALTVSGNAYYRNIRTEGINGNLNTDSLDQPVYDLTAQDQAALTAAGYTGFPTSGDAANTPFPKWSCIAAALERSEPDKTCNAVTFYSKVVQNNYGLSGQMTWLASLGGHNNQLTVGAAFDRSTVDFTQNAQFGYLNPNISITSVNVWEDSSTSADGVPVDTRVNLHGIVPNYSLYAIDSLDIRKTLHLTFAGRYNRDTIDNHDSIDPGGGPGSLDAHDVFSRFNPSVGITYNPTNALNIYANYSQGSRSPTSIELGCADPNNPCNLPNALAGDPPLRQVVTNTWEAGARGKLERNLSWNVGAFRAENRDDILFVASAVNGAGYFKNFGKTRRQGFQANLDGHVRRVSGGLDYTLLDATYQSTETVSGSSNSTNDGGIIPIQPGNQIPLIPRHTGKVFADLQATSRLVLDVGLIAASSSYARGNENNLDQPDGKYYLGPGRSPGYAVVNLGAHYDLNRRLQLVARIDNLLDRHYYTAAQLGPTGFTGQGTFIARPFPADSTGNFPIQRATFFAPGAPRRFWIELRVRF